MENLDKRLLGSVIVLDPDEVYYNISEGSQYYSSMFLIYSIPYTFNNSSNNKKRRYFIDFDVKAGRM